MRKLLLVIMLGVGMLSWTACATEDTPGGDVASRYVIEMAPEDDLPAAIEAIKERGRLLVGVRFDQPLTGMRNEATGRIDGFDAEIGRILAQRIFGTVAEGRNVEFVEVLSKNRISYLQEGKVDVVIATFTMNEERKQEVDFAGPYFNAGQSILTKASDESIKSQDDLAGKRVCSATDSTSYANLVSLTDAETVPLKDYSSCIAALDSAEDPVDAVSTDNVILQGFAASNPGEYRVLDETFTTEPYGIGIKHNSPELREFVNETLEMSFQNGDWKTAFDMTFGQTDMEMPDYPRIERY